MDFLPKEIDVLFSTHWAVNLSKLQQFLQMVGMKFRLEEFVAPEYLKILHKFQLTYKQTLSAKIFPGLSDKLSMRTLPQFTTFL